MSRSEQWAVALTLAVCACMPLPTPDPAPAHDNVQDLPGPIVPVAKPAGPAWLAPGLRALTSRVERPDLTWEAEQQRVLVEVQLAPGVDPHVVDANALAAHGIAPRARSSQGLDLWVPPAALPGLDVVLPDLARVRPAPRPRATLGAVLGQGVARTGAERLHCAGGSGAGVHVAVVDLAFGRWDETAAAGELATTEGVVPDASSVHGTACAEIISDLAPGVVLHPVAVQTLTDLQAFVDALPVSPVQVISDSLVWTGESFGDGRGRLCELAARARQAGALWVTSAGNNGHGTHYRGAFVDDDGDGRHEFAAGDELNDVQLRAGTTLIAELDWDAYPLTDLDLDLLLFRQDAAGPVQVAASSDPQQGADAPIERLAFDVDIGGRYGLAVVSTAGQAAGVALRLLLFPPTELVLQVWQAAGSVVDPAPCAEVLAVGAVPQADYASGEVWRHSARGPTWDGRLKPDLVAPSEVRTSTLFPFYGTSAATPHVVAAVALYLEATGGDAWEMVQLLLADAHRSDLGNPDNDEGHGRLTLDARRAGWQCLPEDRGTCTTSCGTTGTWLCGSACRWALCVAPPERCNGRDDDCDGRVDEDCPQGDGIGCRAQPPPASLLLLVLAGRGLRGARRRGPWQRRAAAGRPAIPAGGNSKG